MSSPRASLLRVPSPVRLLFGPIFLKEMRVAGRRRGVYWRRALYAFALGLIVSIIFITMWQQTVRFEYTSTARLEALQDLAPMLTAVVVWIQFFAISLIGPTVTAGAICDEKRARTLPALLTTPMSAGQIVAGKLTGAAAQILILVLIPTPLLLSIRVFGGLDATFTIGAIAITLSTALLAASLGLMNSIWHKRATSAVIFSYFMLALVQATPVVVAITLREYGLAPRAFDSVVPTSAHLSLWAMTSSLAQGGSTYLPFSSSELWILNTLYNTAIAGVVTFLAVVMLRRTLRREAGDTRRRRSPRRAHSPSSSDAPQRADHDHGERQASRSREVGAQPVLWRETRQPILGDWFKRIIALAAVLLLLGWLYSMVPYDSNAPHITIGVVGIVGVFLYATLSTTGQVNGEREARTWDVLLTTGLTPLQILGGKLVGAIARQWLVPAALLLHFLPAALVGAIHPFALFYLAIIISGPVIMFAGVGLLASMLFRRPVIAMSVNLLLGLLLWGVLPLALALGDELSDWRSSSLHATTLFINPVHQILHVTEEAWINAERSTSSLRFDIPAYDTVRFTEYTIWLVVAWAAYVAVGLGCLAIATRWFNRITGRSS